MKHTELTGAGGLYMPKSEHLRSSISVHMFPMCESSFGCLCNYAASPEKFPSQSRVSPPLIERVLLGRGPLFPRYFSLTAICPSQSQVISGAAKMEIRTERRIE